MRASAPHAASDFARLVAVYLCLILALQGFAAAQALGAGPLHSHTPQPLASSLAELAFSHHGHQHATDQRHHHAHDDTSVQHAATSGDAGLDLAGFALTAALALLAVGAQRHSTERQLQHVQRAAGAWVCRSVAARSLFRPPRPA